MQLFLIQHGDAVAKEVNPDRPLSETGERQIDALGEFLARARIEVDAVVHSSKTRARQTAERLEGALDPKISPRGMDGLQATDPVVPFAEQLRGWHEDTVVCGHMPFVGKLAALLLTGVEDGVAFDFEPGSAVCLERADGSAGWSVRWMLRPQLLGLS